MGIDPPAKYKCRLSGKLRRPKRMQLIYLALLMAALHLSVHPGWAGQAESLKVDSVLPEAPQPQTPTPSNALAAKHCPVKPGAQPAPPPCPPYPPKSWYVRFIDGPEVKPLTPAEKARQAAWNIVAPFNDITILGEAAISVGADAHSPYGPGMRGFGKYVGVSYTEDMTGEFFGTFLIPSIVHQDPYYHRMPSASILKRIRHAITQVVWTQSDYGKGMVNYANLVGYAIDDEIGNLYVPDRGTNLPASGERYGIGLATAPIDNFITEFLPDVAKRIHIRVVLVQRIINQVAKPEGGGPP